MHLQGVFYKMNGSLFFSKVDESHAGSYTCTPYNDLGTDGPSPVINVIVLRPPIFTITPKAIYIQKLGETAELPCQAIDRDGTNHPSIDWKRVSRRYDLYFLFFSGEIQNVLVYCITSSN